MYGYGSGSGSVDVGEWVAGVLNSPALQKTQLGSLVRRTTR